MTGSIRYKHSLNKTKNHISIIKQTGKVEVTIWSSGIAKLGTKELTSMGLADYAKQRPPTLTETNHRRGCQKARKRLSEKFRGWCQNENQKAKGWPKLRLIFTLKYITGISANNARKIRSRAIKSGNDDSAKKATQTVTKSIARPNRKQKDDSNRQQSKRMPDNLPKICLADSQRV